MMLRPYKIGFLFLALATVVACNKTYDPTPEHVHLVYPIKDGKYRIYHVTDTSYESTAGMEALTYYRKEQTDGLETDLLDREVSKLWTYISPDTLGTPEAPIYNWAFDELWTQYSGESYAERIEGNTRYMVLKMPPYQGSSWNGNLFNNLDAETYEYMNIDTTVTVNGTTYENCVYVLQIPYRRPVPQPGGTFFLIEHAYEIYAPGIGKIVRYFKYYEEQRPDVGGPVTIDKESRVYYEELVDHNYD